MPSPRISIRPAMLAGARGMQARRSRRTGWCGRRPPAWRLRRSAAAPDRICRAAVAQQQHAVRRRSATQLAWMLTSVLVSGIGLRQRQFDDQPRAAPCWPSAARFSAVDASARAFDDLAGDGQAQAGIPAETVRPAARCRSARRWIPDCPGGMPGPSSSTVTRATMSRRAGGDDHLAVVGAEGDRIVDQVAEHLAQPFVAADAPWRRRQLVVQHEVRPAWMVSVMR